jgi:hypothetical protein
VPVPIGVRRIIAGIIQIKGVKPLYLPPPSFIARSIAAARVL